MDGSVRVLRPKTPLELIDPIDAIVDESSCDGRKGLIVSRVRDQCRSHRSLPGRSIAVSERGRGFGERDAT
jgi:hypothetical protein